MRSLLGPGKLLAVVSCALAFPSLAPAVPLTGGTGPGGFMLANGATPLQLWLDSTDTSTLYQDVSATPVIPVTTTGDPVGTWRDKSGYGHDAQAVNTTDKRPAWQSTALSSNPTVRFDPSGGTPDGMTAASSLNITSTPFTIFVLDQYYGGTQGRTVQSSDATNWLISKWFGSTDFFATNGFVTNAGTHPTGVNNPTIGVGTIGTAANSASYFSNGVDLTFNTSPSGAPGHLGLGSGGFYSSGVDGSHNELSQADISEM